MFGYLTICSLSDSVMSSNEQDVKDLKKDHDQAE